MCNLSDEFEELSASRGCKRKLTNCDLDDIYIPPKRISPFLNTPKEKKDERKKILKLSIRKIKEIDNADLCLRKSVLIQNTVKRLQREMRHDKLTQYSQYYDNLTTKVQGSHCNPPTSYLKNSLLYDDPIITDTNENISDDMTDTLMKNLEERIGGRLACLSSVKDNGPRVCVTPALFERNTEMYNQDIHECKKSIDDSEHGSKIFNRSISISANANTHHIGSEKPHTEHGNTQNGKCTRPNVSHHLCQHCTGTKPYVSSQRNSPATEMSPTTILDNNTSNPCDSDPQTTTLHTNEMDINSSHDEDISDNRLDDKIPRDLNETEKDRTCKNNARGEINRKLLNIPQKEDRECYIRNTLLSNQESAIEDTLKCSLQMNPVLVNG